MLDNIIVKLLLLDGNESNLLETQQDYDDFKNLIIELTKVKYDIRWCSNEFCTCHPKSDVKNIMKNKNLCDFIECYSSIKIEDIINMTNKYTAVTVYDRSYL